MIELDATEQAVLALAVYGNSRHGMPGYQAAEVARSAVQSLEGAASAEQLLEAFDATFRQRFG